MALDAAVLAELRSLVGSQPGDDDLEERYERLGSVAVAAREVLRGRLADMVREPAKFTAEGDASWDYSANLKFLQEQLEAVEALVAGGADELVATRLTRGGTRR